MERSPEGSGMPRIDPVRRKYFAETGKVGIVQRSLGGKTHVLRQARIARHTSRILRRFSAYPRESYLAD